MSNLLPEKSQQKIRNEYRARFIMTGSSLAIGAALFTALALSPSFAALFVTRPAAVEKNHQIVQSKQDAVDIARMQSILPQLFPVATASSTISVALLEALGKKPGGVHIDTIDYMPGAPTTITLAGSTDSRASIDAYRTALQSDANFSSVKLPVGDLLGGAGGRFTITLSGKF